MTARPFARFACALALAAAAAEAQERVTVYRGARILPGGGAPIENGVLITAGGKVQAVGGLSTPLPDGAAIVDCSGKTITPGLIDASFRPATSPADANEQGSEVTPWLRALDSLDPDDRALRHAREHGVTAVHLMPGTRSVIGGIGAVVKTWGSSPGEMVIADDASLRLVMGAEPSMGNRAIRGGDVDSIYYRRPTTRMGVVWEVRRAFFDAKQEQQTDGKANAVPNPGRDVLQRVLQGRLAAFTTARSEQDIRTALRIADEFGYRTVVDEGQDAHLVADELAAAKVWVLVGAPSAPAIAGTAAADGADPRFATPALLAQKGVPFVITTGTNLAALDLVREAMFAVRHGLSPAQALDAVTILPAKLLGIDDRKGSLAAGKDADFVVWSHDPFDPAATAIQVHIDGTEVLAPR